VNEHRHREKIEGACHGHAALSIVQLKINWTTSTMKAFVLNRIKPGSPLAEMQQFRSKRPCGSNTLDRVNACWRCMSGATCIPGALTVRYLVDTQRRVRKVTQKAISGAVLVTPSVGFLANSWWFNLPEATSTSSAVRWTTWRSSSMHSVVWVI